MPSEETPSLGPTESSSEGPESLSFVPDTPLEATPGSTTQLGFQVKPAGNYEVLLGLFSSDVSQVADARLSATEVSTEATGNGAVGLTAPSRAGVFEVRATVDGLEANRTVAVSAAGFSRLTITASYQGSRELGELSASVFSGQLCEQLSDLFAKSPLSASGPSPLKIRAVPVDLSAAVVVHAGRLAVGCSNQDNLSKDEVREVEVPLADLPLSFDDGSFALELDVETVAAGAASELSGAIEDAVSSFSGETTEDATLILDAMAGVLSDADQEEFLESRLDFGLDSGVLATLSKARVVRDRLGELLADAQGRLLVSPSFEGSIELNATNARFTLSTAGGVNAKDAGFLVGSTWEKDVDTEDHVILSGTLKYRLPVWLLAMAEADRASLAGTSLAADLAETASCEEVSQTIMDLTMGVAPFGECLGPCLLSICESGLATLLGRIEASSTELTSLSVAVSALAAAAEDGTPSSFDGVWLGNSGDGSPRFSGAARGRPD